MAEINAEKNKKKKLKPINVFTVLGRIAFLTSVIMLVVYVIVVFIDSNNHINTFSENAARLSFEQTVLEADSIAFRPFDELNEVAKRLENATSTEDANSIIAYYSGSPMFGDLRYYIKGESYDIRGLPVDGDSNGKDKIDKLAASHSSGCTEMYYDSTVRQDCIAFYIPVFSSEYADGVVSILPTRDLIPLDSLVADNRLAVMLIDRCGKKLVESHSDRLIHDISGNDVFFTFGQIIRSQASLMNLLDDLQNGIKTVKTVDLIDGSYVICSTPLDTFDGNLMLLAMIKADGIIAPEMVYIRHIANISIIAMILLVIGAAYALAYYKKSKQEIATVTYTDTSVGCPNAEMFKKTAGELLMLRNNTYAVALFELRQFRYIHETLNGMETNDFLTMIAKVFDAFCSSNEAYGYLGDGRFASLISVQNSNSISDRVRLIGNVVSKNMSVSDGKIKQYFNIGVANAVSEKRNSVNDLLVSAGIACEMARNNINLPFVTFSESIGVEKKRNEHIEAEMENALATGEFRIFLQPKYNVSGDRIDSAEVLVRWFDPKTGDYRFPGEFIGLFETNGFITKLDHFIYVEALKFLSDSASRGDKVVPIAINVSMVTVNSPDFLNFYVENKKKYQIADNFVIIEFTESFAMEDYDSVRHMVDTLHSNGIRCSLDDFGSGYSSLVMLKNLPFDELKFERSFLFPGHSTEGDDAIVSAMYSLAKKLGIRVVQEGVETKEAFDRVVAGGCDIVQGYYYAKAIPTEEFRLFINSNTSIKYKSRVK